MGICDSQKKWNSNEGIRPQTTIIENPLHSLKSLLLAAKSICKIIVSPNQLASGFFILLFKQRQPFPCLITNEHVVTKKMIEDKAKIDVLYDMETKFLEIKLNPEERFIKNFTEFNIDATLIEILPSDNIRQEYFLLPLKDYIDNYNKLINTKIMIIQYPNGEINYSFGEIKGMSNVTKYGFIHNASTDEGSSGSPIFLEGTTRVIGIHKGGNEKAKKNYGDFIWPIFNFFRDYSDDKNELIENEYLNNEPNNVMKITKSLDNNNINFERD